MTIRSVLIAVFSVIAHLHNLGRLQAMTTYAHTIV